MKSKFLFVTLLVAALVLAGCTIAITTKVNKDGSGAMGFAYKFNKADLDSLSQYGMNAATICNDLTSQGGSTTPADLTLNQEQHGDEVWCVAEKTFATLDELKSELGSGSGFTINTMEISGDKFTFDADVDMSGQTGDTSSIPLEIKINYEFTAPGKVSNHNGDSIKGNTVTWDLPLTSSKNLHLESSTKVTSTSSNSNNNSSSGSSNSGSSSSDTKSDKSFLEKYWWAIAIGVSCLCLLMIGFIVIVILLLRRK